MRKGFLFFRVMDFGQRLDKAIDLYGGHKAPDELGRPEEPYR